MHLKNTEITLLLIGITILLLISCKHGKQPELFLQAQSYISTYPDSALFILETEVDKEKLTESEYALWCLLTTKAKDKCYINHDSDSIINIAVRYYEKLHDKDILMEAYYYMGRVHHDMKNVLRAQDYYLKALTAGKNSHNYAILSRLCYNISYLYLYQDVHTQAFKYQKMALHYSSIDNDSVAKSYALRDMARSFSIQNDLDSALYYYSEALKYTDDVNKINIYNEQGIIYRELKNYEMSYNCMLKALELIPKGEREKDKAIILNLGAAYLGMNKLDSAMIYLQNAVQSKRLSTKANASYYLYVLFKKMGNKEDALIFMEKSKLLLDSLNRGKRVNDLIRMEQLYNHRQTQTEIDRLALAHAQSERNLYKSWLICIVLLLFFSLVLIRLIKKFKGKRKEIEELNKLHEDTQVSIEKNLVRMETLEKSVKEKKEEITRIKTENEKLKELQKKKEASIDNLKSSDIYKKFHQVASEAKTKNAFLIRNEDKEELITFIEKTYPGFADRIKQRCPTIKKEELYLCYLHKIGITSPSILAEFLHLSDNSVTSKRDRLYEKLFHKRGNRALFKEFVDSL